MGCPVAAAAWAAAAGLYSCRGWTDTTAANTKYAYWAVHTPPFTIKKDKKIIIIYFFFCKRHHCCKHNAHSLGCWFTIIQNLFSFLQKIWSIIFFASYVAVRYNGHPAHSGSWRCLMFNYCCAECNRIINRADSRFAPSQWEMALLCNDVFHWLGPREREREIKFIGLFEDRGHRGPYSPYKPFNHNLYIGIIIFPHIDNPQSTGYN